VRQAVRWLQRALDVSDDGVLGPRTMTAAQAHNPDVVLRRMLARRLTFMTALSTWPSFGRGWARRISSLMEV
jgi:lysozyme family protein